MEKSDKRRCGCCGAEIKEKHLGNHEYGDGDVSAGYCERCNAFTVPIGDGEKSYSESMAEAKRRVPAGWSMRQQEDGSTEIKRGVPFRWLWALPVGLAVLVLSVLMAAVFESRCDLYWIWPLLLATTGFAVGSLAWICALFRLTARRFLLGKDELVVESLWLGFIPVRRRSILRTAITQGCIEGRGKDFVAVWYNGYDRREFWRGRDKNELEFIEANLLFPVDANLYSEPLTCVKCGAEFNSEDIDMRADSIVCRNCGASVCFDEFGEADYARTVRFRMKFRPQGVADIRGGFELREGKWMNAAFGAAVSRCAVITLTFNLPMLFEKLSAPWNYISVAIPLFSLTGAFVYIMVVMIVGRFGVHRITAQDGRIAYFHGIGKIGRRFEMPLDSITCSGIEHRSSLFGIKHSLPSAFLIGIKGKLRMKRIFRDCPPVFYHWIEGWFREMVKCAAGGKRDE